LEKNLSIYELDTGCQSLNEQNRVKSVNEFFLVEKGGIKYMSSDKLVCKGNKLFRNNGQSKDKNCQIVSKSNKNIDKSLFDF